MFISVVPNRNSKPAILLRETYREDGKVKNRTLANLSQWSPEKLAALASALDSARNDGPTGGEVVGTVPHGHVHAVLGTARRLGMDALLLARHCRERDLVLAMIVGRVLDPGSKLALARDLGDVRTSTLGEALDLGTVKVEELYKAMDWLLAHQEAIENKLAKRHLQDGALLLYDLTTVFLEGTTCELGAYGHGKEHRNNKLQIVVGLLCNREGIPVSVQVFSGNSLGVRHAGRAGDQGTGTLRPSAGDLCGRPRHSALCPDQGGPAPVQDGLGYRPAPAGHQRTDQEGRLPARRCSRRWTWRRSRIPPTRASG